MKNIFKFLAVAAGVLSFSACNLNTTPVFSDNMAFVAFDKLNVKVAEDGKSALLPITVASVDPVKVAVAYTAVEGGTAKQGVNYKFKDDTGVLQFDGMERTQYIEIEIIDNPGVFTGDLKFQVELASAGSLNIGFNKTCTVTITDNDHPLSSILGTYACAEPLYGGAWNLEIRKDPEDVTVCWFYNISNISSSWVGDDIMYYGNVDIDAGVITIPLGQGSEYIHSSGEPVTLCGLTPDGSQLYTDGSFVINIKDNGKTLEFDKEQGMIAYIMGAGYIGRIGPGATGTKK